MRSVPFLALALFGATVSIAQQRPATADKWQATRDAAETWIRERGVAGIAVAVAKDGKIVFEEGFGWANREKMIRTTPHTMFSLASISKPIAATGLMVLVQRGLVDLDKPANDYLGATKITGLAGDASGATVRRVLSHRAGLPLHYQFFYHDGKTRQRPSMDETVARYANLVTAPGEVFQYSNLGYGLIDYITSRVSGRTWADFMRTEVFLPLGLTHTTVDIGPGLEPFAAERYYDGKAVPFYEFDHPGGSAVYSSAHDLVRFGMFHLKNRLPEQRAILTDATIDAMQKPEGPAFGAEYALGWVVHKSSRGHRLIEHSGGMPGVSTILHLYPDQNLVVTVLTNGSLGWGEVLNEAVAAMIPSFADSLKAARARPATPPRTPAAFTPAAELVGTWKGTIRTWVKTLPFELEIRPDGQVQAQLGEPVRPNQNNAGRQLRALVNLVSFEDGMLNGRFAGRIPTPDVDWVPHTIGFNLKLVNGVLRGQASAQTSDDPVYYSVAAYLELRK